MMPRKTKHIFYSIVKKCRGNVTVELAFVMVLLAAAMVGGYDFSRMMSESHELDQIARSAAQFGIAEDGRSQDTAGILAAAEAAAGDDAENITVTQSTYCLCPGAGSAACGVACEDGSTPQQYLQITINKPYNFLFAGPSRVGEITLSGSAILPVT